MLVYYGNIQCISARELIDGGYITESCYRNWVKDVYKRQVYARVEADGTVKSSVDKFYTQEVLQEMKAAFGAKPGDLILILSGDDVMKTRKPVSYTHLDVYKRQPVSN